MPTIKRTNANVAVGAVVNPLVGSQYEYLPFDALVEFAILADAADTFTASVFSGSDVLMQNEVLDQLAVATPIRYPDDYQIQDVAAAGERLGVQLTNTGGAPGDVRTLVRITPV